MPKFPTLSVPCPACRRGLLPNAQGDIKLCPKCGGTGRTQLPVKRVPFDYSFAQFQFTGAATLPVQLQLDDDAYFEQLHWSLYCPSGNIPLGGLSGGIFFQILDQSQGWNFSNAPIAMSNFASAGLTTAMINVNDAFTPFGAAVPFPLLQPYIWTPGSQVQATMTNTAALPALTILALSMKGYKLYNPDGSPIQLPSLEPMPQSRAA